MSNDRIDPALARGNDFKAADYRAEHFLWNVSDRVATLTLNRAERKNPITFDSYAEMRDLFGRLRHASDVHAVVLHGAGLHPNARCRRKAMSASTCKCLLRMKDRRPTSAR